MKHLLAAILAVATLAVSSNGVRLQEDDRLLELKKLPKKPDAGDGK